MVWPHGWLICTTICTYLIVTGFWFGHPCTWTRAIAYRDMPTQAHQSIMLATTIPYTISIHVLSGVLWMLLGLVQLYTPVRPRRLRARKRHAFIGYAYVLMSVVCSTTAPVVAREFNNDERLHIAMVYISVLSPMFLLISSMYIRYGDVINHVRWMRMNMALGMGSVMMRPMLIVYGLIWSLEPQGIYNDVFFHVAVMSFGGCLLYTIASY